MFDTVLYGNFPLNGSPYTIIIHVFIAMNLGHQFQFFTDRKFAFPNNYKNKNENDLKFYSKVI